MSSGSATDSQAPARVLDLPQDLEGILGKVAPMIANYLRENYNPSTRVHEYMGPEALEKVFPITLPDAPAGYDALLEDLRKCCQYGMRTGHIRFFNQLWAGTDVAAVISEMFLGVLNTSMYTYEVAPVFTLMEMHCLDRFLGMVGWNPAEAEGTFAPGGAHANLLGILAARHIMFPESKKNGIDVAAVKPVAFTSTHSHYTIKRGLAVMGMGMNACVNVDVNDEGMMDPVALEAAVVQAKAEGKTPFMVNATCGTTVYGAYDPLNAIADVCKRHNMWLHVDACWGGHCLFSSTERVRMAGVERADSVAVTGTKCLGLPQQCAAVLVRRPGALRSCNAMGADYLFHEYEEKNYDVGDLTLNCGRRVDAFKLWCAWKVHGRVGLEERVDHAFACARYCDRRVRESNGVLEMAHHPQSLNVCFWYVPPRFRNQPRSAERDAVLDRITERIRRQIQLDGKVLTNFADVPGVPHFFRHITCNPGASWEDHEAVLQEIIRIGDEIASHEKL
jgi:glutamate/tyrosine decarboxylase-like PLP-dependent enzyme